MPLHYKIRGDGEPLVLVHGLFGSLENLGAIARILSESYRVYSVDLPNHGRSLHTEETDLEHMAEVLHEWLLERNLEPAHLLGHSLGGKVAMELALRRADRVNKLVVVDIAPVHYGPRHNEIFDAMFAVDLDSLTQRSQAEAILAERVKEPAVRSFLLKNLTKTDTGYAWRMNLPGLCQAYNELLKANVEGRFDGATLFVKGAHSNYVLAEHKDAIQQRFPRASLRVVADTGHWVHAEKPELVARLVKRFLTQEADKT